MQPDVEKLARVAANEAGDAVNFDWRLVIQSILSALTEQGFVVVPEDREPDAFLVEWTHRGDQWVQAEADEPTAFDRAKRMGGTYTPLYRAMLAAHKGTCDD